MKNHRSKPVRVERLEIENYRCIRNASVKFHPSVTVFIGKNGSGKTSILDALALSLQSFQRAWGVVNGPKQASQPVRIDNSDLRDGQRQGIVSVDIDSTIYNIFGDSAWRIDVRSDRSKSNDDFSNLIQALNRTDARVHKPLFVYYRQDRAFEGSKRNLMRPGNLGDSLEGDLRAISDLEAWWDRRDSEEARTVRDSGSANYRDPQLEAIRRLVRKIDSFDDIIYSASKNPIGLHFRKSDGTVVHVSKLSSGERSYIILLADLARRLQISMPETSLEDIPGVILIDEIELNLHPAWQSEVLPTLSDVFKSCQFVVTTHSPLVISGVQKECVRVVRRSADGEVSFTQPLSTKGRSSNYLLEGVFETSERFPEVDRMFAEFNRSVERKDVTSAENILKRILAELEGSSPEVVVLKKRLKALKD